MDANMAVSTAGMWADRWADLRAGPRVYKSAERSGTVTAVW